MGLLKRLATQDELLLDESEIEAAAEADGGLKAALRDDSNRLAVVISVITGVVFGIIILAVILWLPEQQIPDVLHL